MTFKYIRLVHSCNFEIQNICRPSSNSNFNISRPSSGSPDMSNFGKGGFKKTNLTERSS